MAQRVIAVISGNVSRSTPPEPPRVDNEKAGEDPCKECPVRSYMGAVIKRFEAEEDIDYKKEPSWVAGMAAVAATCGGYYVYTGRPESEAGYVLFTTYLGECQGPKAEKRWSVTLPWLGRVAWGRLVLRCPNEQVPLPQRRELFSNIQKS